MIIRTSGPVIPLPPGDLEIKPSGEVVQSNPPVASPPPPPKTVSFTYTNNHQWEVTVACNDPKFPFTERDWNQLERLLVSRRSILRRQAALAYLAEKRKAAILPTTTDVLSKP